MMSPLSACRSILRGDPPASHLPTATGPLEREKETVGSFSIASMENLQRTAAEDARLEGGALPAQAARRAVRRGAAAAEDGTAAEYPEAAAAEELRLRREDGAGGEEEEEGQQGGAHLDPWPSSKVSCHL